MVWKRGHGTYRATLAGDRWAVIRKTRQNRKNLFHASFHSLAAGGNVIRHAGLWKRLRDAKEEIEYVAANEHWL